MKLCWHRMLLVLVASTGLTAPRSEISAQEIVDGAAFDSQRAPSGSTAGVVTLNSISSHLRFRHFEGADAAGFQDDATTFELLRPVWLDDFSMWYFDGRLGLTNESDVFGNTGLGFRRLNSTGTRTYGGSVWFDVDGRFRQEAQTFYQFGVGLESLGEFVDFRANFYKPIGDDRVSDPTTLSPAYFDDFNIFVNATTRSLVAMKGLDLESTIALPVLREYDFRGTAGYYHYRAEGSDNINGVRGRLEISPFRDVTLLGQVQSDDTFGTTGFFAASWTFSKGDTGWARGAIPGSLRDRMATPTVRNYQMIFDNQVDTVQTILTKASNGAPFRVFHVDSSAAPGGNGSAQSPFVTLAQATNEASDIIYAYADSVFNESVTLQAGQRLLGEGPDTHFIDSVELGAIPLPRVTDGLNRPTIQAAGAQAVLLAADTEVSGFTIRNTAGHGVFGDDFIGNVTLRHNTISNVTGSGLFLNDVIGDVTVADTDITGSALNGIRLQNHTGNFRFSDGSITGSMGTAVSVENFEGSIAFSGTDINYTGGRVIDFDTVSGGPVNFEDTTIVNSNGTGIRVVDSSVDMTFEGASITDAVGDAVTLADNTGSYTFQDLNVTTAAAGARGLVADNTGTVNVSGTSTINATGGAALDVADSNIGMSFASLASANSTTSGVRLNNTPGTLTVTAGTTISETNLNGIDIRNSAGLVADLQGTTSITGTGIAGGAVGHGVFLANNAGSTFRLGTLDVTTDNGGGLIAENSGSVSSTGGTIVANAGPAVDVETTGIDLAFASLTSNNSVPGLGHTGHGIHLDQTSGNFTVIGDTTINSPAGAGINVTNLGTPGTSIQFQGVTTITNPALQGVNVANITSGGIAFDFGQLDVLGHGGAGINVSNAAGSLDFGLTSVSAPQPGNASPGINMQNSSADVTFASATVTDSGGDGILLTNNSGSFNAQTGLISNSAGTAVSVQGGTADVTFAGDVVNSDGLVIHVANTTGGTINFPASGGTIVDAGGDGVLIDNVANRVNISNLSLSNTTGDGVSILNSTGMINFANSEILNATGTDFLVSGGRPVVTYAGDINNTTGHAVRIENTTNGSVTFSSGVISDDGGLGVLLNNVDGDVALGITSLTNTDAAASAIDIQGGSGNFTLTNASISGAAANGFNVVNSTATIDVTGGNISNTSGTAFNVSGGSPTINYGGSITNSAGRVVDIQDMVGGQVLIFGGVTAIGGQGVRINNNAANVGLFSANISGTTDAGISATNNKRQLIFQNLFVDNSATSQPAFVATGNTGFLTVGAGSTVATANNTAVQISGVSDAARTPLNVVFESISATGGGFTNGLLLQNVSGDFTVTGFGNIGTAGGIIDGASGNGVQITNATNVSLNFMQVINSGQLGISGTGLENFALSSTQVAGSGGVSIETLAPLDGTTTFTAQANSITTTFGDGITWLQNGGTTNTTTPNISGNITGNNINAAAEGIDVRLGGGFTALALNGNTVTANSADPASGAAVNLHVGGTANAIATVTRNNMVAAVPNVFQAVTDSPLSEFRLILGDPTNATLGNTVGNDIANSAFVLNNGSGGRFELVGDPFDSPSITVFRNNNRTVDLDATNNPDDGVNVNVIGTVNVVDPLLTPFP